MAKVCLDAGHYGKYNRSPVVSGYYESVQMWKLTEFLAAELTALGIHVVKTRSNQAKDLSLFSRGQKAKGCDFFISLHSNACGTESVDYPVSVVMCENAKTTIDDRSEDIGLKLAKVVQSIMGTTQNARTMTRASASDRDGNGLKDDEYYGVLQSCKTVGVPGIILEHSFHSNRKAANWLLSDANLKTLAKAEAKCIAAWLGVNPAPTAAKPDAAKAKNTAYAKTWTTTTALNMRSGAGINKPILSTLKKGAKFRCYGFYTTNNGTIWLYGVADGKTGYCSKNYLK